MLEWLKLFASHTKNDSLDDEQEKGSEGDLSNTNRDFSVCQDHHNVQHLTDGDAGMLEPLSVASFKS